MDAFFMKRALELAEKGKGFVDPNPLVGAVIVKNGEIIGEGYHQKFGDNHAEVNACINASKDITESEMFVTLEPCAHTGKTPPCASLIIEKKFSRVVIASVDPNPLVSGKGIKMLQDAGIEVVVGVLDQENRALNKVFYKYMEEKKPYVVLKTAMSLDGKIATYTKESKWITNASSRHMVHQMRHELMGIMVGVKTVIYDDPSLTCRLEHQTVRQPIRIILDTDLEIPFDSVVVKTAKEHKTIVFTAEGNLQMKIDRLKKAQVEVVQVQTKQGELDLTIVMDMLANQGISSVLLEGGSTLNFGALNAGIVDEVHTFIAPKIIGGQTAVTPVGGQGFAELSMAIQLQLRTLEEVHGDIHLVYDVIKEV